MTSAIGFVLNLVYLRLHSSMELNNTVRTFLSVGIALCKRRKYSKVNDQRLSFKSRLGGTQSDYLYLVPCANAVSWDQNAL